MTKANIDASPSKLSMYDEKIFLNVGNILRRQCDDGWMKKKKLGMCVKSTTVR